MPNECIIRSGYDRNLINDRCEKSLQASSLSHNQNENIQLNEKKKCKKNGSQFENSFFFFFKSNLFNRIQEVIKKFLEAAAFTIKQR